MNMDEYNKIKNYNYKEYCEYLQNKYGKARFGYYTENWNQRKNITRTKEGLIIHHIKEDKAIMLSNSIFAKKNPYEYQSADNLTYCNYLEHLLLHILIVEENATNNNKKEEVGIGGIINFIVPELNDWYSGYYQEKVNNSWQYNCYIVVKDNEDVFLELIKRYLIFVIDNYCDIREISRRYYSPKRLFRSYNSNFGLWKNENNLYIYRKINKIIVDIFK